MKPNKKNAFDLQYIKGIGPKRAKLLQQHNLGSPNLLLNYFPRKYIDRSTIVALDKLVEDQEVTVVGRVEAAGLRRTRKTSFFITISDGKGLLEAIWFNSVNYFKNVFKVGDLVSLSGKVSYYRGFQLSHPDFDKLGTDDYDKMNHTGRIIPFYPVNEYLKKAHFNSTTFRNIFTHLLKRSDIYPQESLPKKLIEKHHFPTLEAAYKEIHFPQNSTLLESARSRFIYEEFFYLQLLFALQSKQSGYEKGGISFSKKSDTLEKLYTALPFKMTNAQKRVVKEIRQDMKSSAAMNRLLQGDVGSGKTLVAMMAALVCLDNGFQVALMVPTEILAEQHFSTLNRMLNAYNIEVLLLKGAFSAKEKKAVIEKISNGTRVMVIGTHALVQETVSFSKLGLVIIDEQHRFGVLQRGALISKGPQPDVLVMTATPIPRTLAMTAYGSLSVSAIDEMPANRKAIQTVWRFENQAEKINHFIRKEVAAGQQAYIVYPLVEESEKMDLKAASEAFVQLKENAFSDIEIGLLHGRMKSHEKEEVMRRFSLGEIKILISTTVIEVGVDVPNATIMVIEHSERFGLAQLHQLRGRVGRGEKQSYCILKSAYNIGEIARERIRTMTETNDGFVLAEKDLEIRGWGDFFGKQQSGMPHFKIAHPVRDKEMLEKARNDAFELVEKDPQMRMAEHEMVYKKLANEYKERLELYNIS